MNKYPTINYIGNKQKMIDWILESIPFKEGKILDLFCGGCSVSYALKNAGYSVYANDALYSNYVLAKAIIENNNEVLTSQDLLFDLDVLEVKEKRDELKYLANKIYFDFEVDELAKLVIHSKRLRGYKNYIFLALLRRSMIRKIPYSRMNIKWEEIQKLRNEEYSYKKYGRYRHYHNIPFVEHIRLNLDEYNNAVFQSKNNAKCYASNCDAIDCIKKLRNKVDLIYMDPPYPSTMNRYNDFYGAYDRMFNINEKIIIDLTNKNTFLDNFTKIMKIARKKTSYVLISLNNKCYPSCEILIENIKHITENLTVFKKEHIYKITGKENKKTNHEVLILCKFKEEYNAKESYSEPTV